MSTCVQAAAQMVTVSTHLVACWTDLTDAMEAALVSELDARRHGGSKPSKAKQSVRTSRTSGVLVQT